MPITNPQSGTNVHEIADGIYRINTPVALPGGLWFFVQPVSRGRRRAAVVSHRAAQDVCAGARRGWTVMNGGNMKKAIPKDKEMRDHYDFTGGVRGKSARRYAEGSNIVVLDPDVARLFPNRQAVNDTLRAVAKIVQIQERRRDQAKKTALSDGAVVAGSDKVGKSRAGRGV